MKKVIFGIIFSLAITNCWAGAHYQSGKIKNLTATTSGIMIMMDKGLPDNCVGTPYGWLLIKEENKALTSAVLTIWASGKGTGTVYTSGRVNGTGYCIVNQFDPTN